MVRLLEPKAMTKSGMTYCLIFTIVALFAGMASTFKWIDFNFGNFIMSLLFLFGGGIMILESVFEGKKFKLENLTERPFDSIGLFLGLISIVVGIATLFEITVIVSAFSGISGYILGFLIVFLLIEGYSNRS